MLVILGLFVPLVIQAEPFGQTEIAVFDTDFLSAPMGFAEPDPEEPAPPEWIDETLEPVVTAVTIPTIPFLELMS